MLLISKFGNLNILNDYGQTPIAFGSESLINLLGLRNALATYNGDDAVSNTLPSEYDNNKFMKKVEGNESNRDNYLAFKHDKVTR